MSTDEKIARLLGLFEECRVVFDQLGRSYPGAEVLIGMRPDLVDIRVLGIGHDKAQSPGFNGHDFSSALNDAIGGLESHLAAQRGKLEQKLAEIEGEAAGIKALLARAGAS